MQYRLSEIAPLNHDVTRLTLTPVLNGAASNEVVSYLPGQYLEIVLADDIRCAYSIACAPRSDGSLELHVRAMPQSENYVLLASRLVTGAILDIALPFGSVVLADEGDRGPLLLLAGSTGFSQAKAMIEGWLALGSERPLWVYWGGRNARDLYLHEWMLGLALKHSLLRYVPVVSEPDGRWQGRTGFVHRAVLADVGDFSGMTVVGCGSPPMVYAAYDDFIAAGMEPGQFLSDVFAYAPR